MSKPQVVIYGASGYTGKLVAWHLAERGIPFIAAGRDQKRLEEEMAKVPELKGHHYECVACPLEEKAMTELFSGTQVVYNIVGPFMQLSEPVVKACLAAGVHYLDTTGEQDWIMMLEERYGEAFKKKDLLLCPANAFMWTAGEIAAQICLESPGIDTLDILYIADSATSVASTASFLRMTCRDQFYLKNNKFEIWPHTKSYNVSVPGMHQTYQALPWSGAAEPVWFRTDERVSNCEVLVAFKNRDVMNWVVERITEWYEQHRDKPRDEFEKISNEWGRGLVSVEPPREVREENRSLICCHGRGNTESKTVVLRGNSPYIQAGVWAAESLRRILIGQLRATGFASPCKAFGHRELLASTVECGYLTWNETSI